ncbi:MAG: prolyl oligopeptidase family serine peptidase [Acidobacteriota bacterium]
MSKTTPSYRCLGLVWLLLPVLLAAEQKPALTSDDYGKWEVLWGRPALSSDGQWLAHQLRRINQERELRVRAIDQDQDQVFAWGESPLFSEDSRWLAFAVGLSEEEKEKLEEEKKPLRLGAGLLELASGEKREFSEVSQFSFDESGRFLALLGYRPEEPKGTGANLRLLDLQANTETAFGNVAEYSWSEFGSLIALAVATGKDEGNGVQVYDAVTGRLRSLDSSGSAYSQLAWREDHPDLALLRSLEPASEDGEECRALAWRGLDQDQPERMELDPSGAGLALVRHMKPLWSDDGRLVAVGLRPVKDKEKDKEKDKKEEADPSRGNSDEPEADDETKVTEKEKKEKDAKLPNLQIWHSSDVRIFPQQKASEKRDAQRVLLAVWHLDSGRMVQIGTDLREKAELLEGWKYGLEKVSKPYPWGEMFGRPYHDVWVVDLTSSQRKKVLEKVRYSWDSAGGGYLLSFDGKDYWSTALESREKVNLTHGLPVEFADTEYDTPTDMLPPYGVGGWLEGDAAVFLYDKFDVWKVQPDGSGAVLLTQGRGSQLRHRLEDLDPDEEAIDPESPLYFSIWGEWSEKRGFARLLPGAEAAQQLILQDKSFRGLQKAGKAEVYLYRAEARDDSPDYFTAGPDLGSPRQVSRTNAFQDDYAWTRSELFEFQSESGRRLQAALLYPVNHDPSQRYPMIVYTYEILSSRVHSYEPPSQRDYYNFTAWTQQGYFVLLPDIVYTAREPGVSAVQAVRPAVAKVVQMGLADAAKVGLIGHSWGGYQATYLPTRTGIFAASVAGAPLTDFVSFMGQIHWRPGMPELSHWETGQARMEVPFWEDPEAHRRNSPIHKVHEMETPLLMAFGDNDGVVDWDQGTEFYNFARRAGKQMVLLIYEGEGHGFEQEANQVDYHRRILEWFGHYLKGEPAPDWITQGVPLEKLEDEKKRLAQPTSESKN